MIQIDPDDGSLRIEFPHGEAATIDGLPVESQVVRGSQRALFLEPQEGEVMGNMITYLLRQITRGELKVRPGSDDLLRAVQERLTLVFAE